MKRISQFSVFILSTLIVLQTQADTWPQQEAGAESAGFSAEGIEALDNAMREIVANQDVAGMVWLLAKDGEVATYEHSEIAQLSCRMKPGRSFTAMAVTA